MKSDSLKKLTRTQLLTMLRDQELEIAELKKTNERLKKKLNDRQLRIESCGSIAEASLKLTAIFEEAQKAVDLYKENCRLRIDSSKDAAGENESEE